MKENEKIILKRKKSTGEHLDRLKPNTLYPGPNDDCTILDEVEKEQPLPEVDVEKERMAKEEAEKLATAMALQKAKEEEARRKEEEALQKAKEEETRRKEEEALQKAKEEARKKEEEIMRKIAEEKARMEELQRQQVSAAEVKTIVSDETAQVLIEQEEETEKVYGNKKAIINLDVISAHFLAGETVTVNILKEKKLINDNVYFVKVLARGVLDKPLIIKAQDFSIDAAKMIELTGGKVIILTKRKYF